MLMTTFRCGECRTRVEAAVSSELLHCPVCAQVLDEEAAVFDSATLGANAAAQPIVERETGDETRSLEEELRRIDRKWERYQRVHLFRPARGPARVPSKRRAITKIVLFALPVVVCIQLVLTGRALLALLVLVCAGFGIYRAAAEYVMAESRELAEFRYQVERDNAERQRLPT